VPNLSPGRNHQNEATSKDGTTMTTDRTEAEQAATHAAAVIMLNDEALYTEWVQHATGALNALSLGEDMRTTIIPDLKDALHEPEAYEAEKGTAALRSARKAFSDMSAHGTSNIIWRTIAQAFIDDAKP